MKLGNRFRSIACLLTVTGSSLLLPAQVNAGELDWGTPPFTWGDGDTTNTYLVEGATIRLDFSISGGTFDANRPQLAGPGTGVTGFTGGLADPSLLTTYDFGDVSGTSVLTVESTNAAGDRVPLDNLNYTIIDIDRSCNREWQDVVSTRGVLIGSGPVTTPGDLAAVGSPVTPNIESITNVGGTAGSTGTLEDISLNPTGAAYTPAPSSLTFRGVTFGRALGDPGPSVRPDPSGRGAGCTVPPDVGNRGAEADNSLAEGNVALSFSQAIDRLEFQFGNGVTDGTLNGLGFNTPQDPEGHGVGVLAQFTFNPGIIGVAKSATAATPDLARPGNFLTTFTINVQNLGEVDLNSVQVTDDLNTTFPDGFVVTSAPVVGAPRGATTAQVAHSQYGTGGDFNLLTTAASNVLDDNAAGGAATIQFTVSFNPGAATDFSNQAQASGITPGGGLTRDLSNDGTDVDENDNEDPTDPDDQTPTPITITQTPAIGVTKQVTNVVNNGGGTYTITYRHIVRNLGSENLTTVQLSDQDIQDSFRQGNANGVTSADFVPGSVTAFASAPAGFPAAGYTPLIPTAGFDGDGANLELATVASLPIGGYGIVDYQVIVNPEDPLTPGIQNLGDGALGNSTDDIAYESQANVTGVGATSTTTVTDLSDDVSSFPGPALPVADQLPRDLSNPANGTSNDPAPGGIPQSSPIPANDPNASTNENNRTPITLPAGPQIGVTKQVSSIVNSGGVYTITYRQIVSNLGTEVINGVTLTEQPASAIFRQGLPNGVTSADFVPGSVSVPDTPPSGFPAGYVALSGVPTFDSAGNLQLATAATLPVGGYGIVDYQVVINPIDPFDPAIQNLGDGSAADPTNDDFPYESQVTATGTGATSGVPVSDLSDDVTNVPGTPLPPAEQLPRDLSTPANGNATDPEENTVTPLTLLPAPQIGLTKQVTSIVANDDGSFDVTFEYVVVNVGDVDIDGVTISDNYDDQFTANNTGPIADYEVISVTPLSSTASGPLIADPGAPNSTNGSNLIPLVSAGSTVFSPGQQATAQVVVNVSNLDVGAIYDANAIATAEAVSDDAVVSDLSDDVPQFGVARPEDNVGVPGPGTNPNDPTDPQNTATSILFSPLQLFKRITSVTKDGVETRFDSVVGDVPTSVLGEVDVTEIVGDLGAGDTVEYTIYYFNLSPVNPLVGIEVCDPVPSPLTIVDTSLSSSPSVPSIVLSPLVALSTTSNPGYSCGGSSGTQGAAVFSVGDIPSEGNGFVRFSTLIP